jgi:hypothetical protein
LVVVVAVVFLIMQHFLADPAVVVVTSLVQPQQELQDKVLQVELAAVAAFIEAVAAVVPAVQEPQAQTVAMVAWVSLVPLQRIRFIMQAVVVVDIIILQQDLQVQVGKVAAEPGRKELEQPQQEPSTPEVGAAVEVV